MKNYRKAKKGETTCEHCRYSGIRWWSKRTQCCIGHAGSPPAVGKKYTCDHATEKE